MANHWVETDAAETKGNDAAWHDRHEIRQAIQRRRLLGQGICQKQVEAMMGWRLVGEARGRPKKTASSTIEKVL